MNQYVLQLLIGALMVFTIFPVRQYARNWMAVKLGDDTPITEGKLTLNPLAHVDPIGCIFMILIGFGWGRSASINPRKFKTRNYKLAMLMVALAGPVANLLFAFIMMLVFYAFQKFGMSSVYLQIVSYIILLNIRLAVFLLLPIPGFDGGDILMLILPTKFIWKISRYFQYITIAMILLVCFGPLRAVVDAVTDSVIGFLSEVTYLIAVLFLGK